jgi:outer membrane protein assembly factor BamD
MPLSRPILRGSIVILTVCLAAAGCHSRGRDRDVPQSGPDILYQRARKSLNAQDYDAAIRVYEALAARYPFAEQARQGKLDVLYAYYRRNESESAIDAAEQFIRENPKHPRIDYAWYIKGLVDFERTPNGFERLFGVDLNERPPATARRAFASFKTLVEQYPQSEYAHDARRRMIYLRNRLADYELHVARYYLKRGAYVAAAQRAKQAIEQYDGAPATREALGIMIASYDRLGLEKLAAQTREVYGANFGAVAAKHTGKKQRAWWRPWG